MFRTTKAVFLILGFSLVAGCKRLDGDTVCEGTVVDRATQARIADATVGVYVKGSSGGGLGGGYVLKDTHTADGAGNFAFQINDNESQLLLRAFTDQGYETIWQEALYLRAGRNNKKLVLKAQAPAWVRIRFRDQLPLDSAFVRVSGSIAEGPGFYSMVSRDTSIVYWAPGNYDTVVSWRITPFYGPLVTGSQTVYTPGLDTTDVEIIY